MKKFFVMAVSIILTSMTSFVYAQSEWENVNTTNLRWSSNLKLRISSHSLANLIMWNPSAQSKEDERNNKWSSQNVRMGINWQETRPWRITFSIWNSNNRPDYKYKVYDEHHREKWHTGEIYWGYIIKVNKAYGDTYIKYYCDRKGYNSSYSYTDTYDNIINRWVSSYDRSKRDVVISYDGVNTITVSSDGQTLHTFYGAKSISEINICAGPAAEVHVTNFTIQRQSIYGKVKPFLTSGDSKLRNNDYWGAIEEYSKAIDNDYKNYDIYYKRASAYYMAEFYTNAIDDYTKAISYRGSEEAYFYRGLAKLNRNDATGIEDLKRGGTKGQALVREFFEVAGSSTDGVAQNSKYTASGSGFFVDSRGYIATNYHVIEGSRGIDVLVTKNGQTYTYSAKCIVYDKANDLAIIKITDSNFLGLADIPYTLNYSIKDVGTKVFSMGYPELSYLGDEIKVTDGIISSKTGYQGDVTTYQISAPIQHGSSGGPLFDESGNVVGITNAGIEALQNVGYAIKSAYLINLISASPETIHLPRANELSSVSLTEKIKRISPYVVIIKIW